MKNAALFFSLLMLISGCATAPLPELTIKPASQYLLTQDKDGLKIAIDPFLEPERQKEFFRDNLLAKGILPVLIIVENKSGGSVFYLQKDQASVSFSEKESAGSVVTSGRSLTYESPDKGVKAAFYVSPLIVASIWQSSENKREATTQIMVNNELRERTLNPNESQHGFLFFKLAGENIGQDVSAVNLKVLNIKSKETMLFDFSIK